MTISKNLMFITSKFIPNRMQEVFIAAMRIIKNIGYHRVFRITD